MKRDAGCNLLWSQSAITFFSFYLALVSPRVCRGGTVSAKWPLDGRKIGFVILVGLGVSRCFGIMLFMVNCLDLRVTIWLNRSVRRNVLDETFN